MPYIAQMDSHLIIIHHRARHLHVEAVERNHTQLIYHQDYFQVLSHEVGVASPAFRCAILDTGDALEFERVTLYAYEHVHDPEDLN